MCAWHIVTSHLVHWMVQLFVVPANSLTFHNNTARQRTFLKKYTYHLSEHFICHMENVKLEPAAAGELLRNALTRDNVLTNVSHASSVSSYASKVILAFLHNNLIIDTSIHTPVLCLTIKL